MVRSASDSILDFVAMFSNNAQYDRTYIGNYALLNVLGDLERIPGVGDVNINDIDYSMRVWLASGQDGAVQSDAKRCLDGHPEQNSRSSPPVASATTSRSASGRRATYSITTQGRLADPGAFGDIILRSNSNAATLRLKDVARVRLGTRAYAVTSSLNGIGVPIAVYLQPERMLATMQALSTRLEG